IDTWRILFNNDESYANITLHTTDGMLVYNQSIDNPRRGQEEVLNLNNFTPGIYLVNIKTTAGNLTRKVIVR
ncbi:MAG: T9SS type A sorting domain-containing protein, partial [Bacteroidaceae bacterium]|nr:T9SS type A sorting domain-containing protein [Bacteroidaceae bacterium]